MGHMRMRKVPMRLGWIAMSKCITGDTPSDDPFLRFGSYPVAPGRTIDCKGHD